MEDIKTLIEQRILNDAEELERAREIPESYHASSVGFCERQIFLTKLHAKMFGLKEKSEMTVGSCIHYFVQGIKTVKDLFDIEVPIKYQIEGSPVFIVGKADLVLKEFPYVIDIKSSKSLMYLQNSPMSHQVPQLLVYMKCLGADEGELLYIEKATFIMLQHKIKFNQELFDQTCKKVVRVYEAIKKWENDGAFNKKIPFLPCGCYFCRNEILYPEFKKLLEGAI